MNQANVVLITGAAKRIGAAIAKHLHQSGCNIIIHYHQSKTAADNLVNECNQHRSNSAYAIQANLTDLSDIKKLAEHAETLWGRIDHLINNASSFYATPLQSLTEACWDDIIGTNLKAPLFLAKALADSLAKQNGSIINLLDSQYQTVRENYVIYSIAKMGLAMLTKSLAKELAPNVRVNGIAPGAVLPPSDKLDRETLDEYRSRVATLIPLQRSGSPDDIAKIVALLMDEFNFVTGQIITVDGGKSL